jgi:D-arabinose 1-dehydrogenase-like Zn-dependent alcohol dehydrogenase
MGALKDKAWTAGCNNSAGFLGGLLCQLASRSGVSVIAISRRRFALKAAEKCGARHTCLLGELSEVIESVNKAFGSECDCVIEATGFQYPLTVAGALVKNGGRLIIADIIRMECDRLICSNGTGKV